MKVLITGANGQLGTELRRCFARGRTELGPLPEKLLHDNYGDCIRIPMLENMRSLNLSNSVAIIAYEVLRQFDFEGLQGQGHLTQY